ncbi:MBL fold metallo-hydrolase [Deinococcus maricopensis]|uniref:Beta-lactamase domain protein n=1 Tax=Deinococcus maricopensis (strain DSM 21211 / LMG 22137 / NRRL B-23946 / LB-34) TaxID=709986 RepID=E8U909_DEIML|nr:MBL fold metallo-hydrolase [Deinococcus maricopensis]ADV67548.1 beta-lactamase domain protein [Deinococcus maricopensis DSM 21211]
MTSTHHRTIHGAPARFPTGLQEVAPSVFAYLMPNGSWSESNAGLIVSGDEALLVDTQFDRHLTLRLLQAVHARVPHAHVRTLVNTHADGDHTFGNSVVRAPEVVMTERAARDAAHEPPGGIRMFQRLMGGARGWPLPPAWARTRAFVADMLQPFDFDGVSVPPPTRTFSGSVTLNVAGRRVEVVEAGRAHTASDAVVIVPDAGVVFAGDLLFVGVTPVMWAGPVEDWIRHLQWLLTLDAAVFVPGHGPVCGAEGVQALIGYFEFLAIQGGARLRAGLSPYAAARDLLLSPTFRASPYAAWLNPERAYVNLLTMSRPGGVGETPAGPLERVRAFHGMAQLAALR